VLNEQDSTNFFTGTIQQYVAMLQSCYNAIKAVAPEIHVSVGGTTYTNMPWYESLYDASGRGYFDAAAIHPYANGAAPEAPCYVPPDGREVGLACIPHLRDLMLSRGDDKAIIVTEFGWTTTSNPEPQQAEYAVRAYRYVRANFQYVTLMVWYKDAGYPTDEPSEDGFGLLRSDLTPRPVYTSLSAID
jgi:endo-1,4-beta-mannosidase